MWWRDGPPRRGRGRGVRAGGWPGNSREILGPTPVTVFQPTVFVDIEPFLEQKVEAMACYQSKLVAPPHPRSLETIRSLAHLRGSTVYLAAAEAFMLVREILEMNESPAEMAG